MFPRSTSQDLLPPPIPSPSSFSMEVEEEISRKERERAATAAKLSGEIMQPHNYGAARKQSVLFPSSQGQSPISRQRSTPSSDNDVEVASSARMAQLKKSSGLTAKSKKSKTSRSSISYGADSEADERHSYALADSKSGSIVKRRGDSFGSEGQQSRVSQVMASSGSDERDGAGYLYLDGASGRTSPENFRDESPRLVKAAANSGRIGLKNGHHANSIHGVVFEPSSIQAEDSLDAVKERTAEMDSEETWYFLRALVEQELSREQDNLWRLADLDIPTQTLLSDNRISNTQEAPIYRYLIKHFLLTLPILRDCGDQNFSHVLWDRGLHPLILAVHELDLSHSVDTGTTSLFGTSIRKGLGRFVSAGLKLRSNAEDRTMRSNLKDDCEKPADKSYKVELAPPVGVALNDPEVPDLVIQDRSGAASPTPSIFNRLSLAYFWRGSKEPAASISSAAMYEGSEPNSPSLPFSSTVVNSTPDLYTVPTKSRSTASGARSPPLSRSTSLQTGATSGVEDDASFLSAMQSSASATDVESDDKGREAEIPFAEGVSNREAQPYDLHDDGYESDWLHNSSSRTSRYKASPIGNESSTNENNSSPSSTAVGSPTSKSSAFAKKAHLTSPRSVLSGDNTRRRSRQGSVTAEVSDHTSRRLPILDPISISAMALPLEIMHATPVTSAPLKPKYMPREAVPWPFETAVAFRRDSPYERLKWGGFEADLVGVRKGLFGHDFIIRIRRPERLDEYVLRSEAQFSKYRKILEKYFPNANVRQIFLDGPKHGTKADLVKSTVAASAAVNEKPVSHDDDGKIVMDSAENVFSVSQSPAPGSRRHSVLQKGNRNSQLFSLNTKKATLSSQTRPYSIYSLSATRSTTALGMVSPIDLKKVPPYEARRRELRAWLRDTLAIRTVGHHKETAAFLLQRSIVPKKSDEDDISLRQRIDESRRAALDAQTPAILNRAKALCMSLQSVKQEVVSPDGFIILSQAIRDSTRIEHLPPRYIHSIEWMRNNFAEFLYDSLIVGDCADANFTRLKNLHAALPYSLLRQAFKFKNPERMVKMLRDMLVGKKFGAKPVTERILSALFNSDSEHLARQARMYENRINSRTMVSKLNMFVKATREKKMTVRKHAYEHEMELVLAIVRGADSPRLNPDELARIAKASRANAVYISKKEAGQIAFPSSDDENLRLVLDLKQYLRVASQQRDANLLSDLTLQPKFVEALETVTKPAIELIKRIYLMGNAAQAVADFQANMEELLTILEALRARVQDPQKGVRMLARFLSRHQQGVYDFIRRVHNGETIIDESFQWAWTASIFVRRGLAESIDFDSLLEETPASLVDLIGEISAVVEYHRKKRDVQYGSLCRRIGGDMDVDDPIIVQGDGKGRSKTTPNIEYKPLQPRLSHIASLSEAFQSQINRIFNV